MSSLIEMRQELRQAELAYTQATSMLDDNGTMLIVAKDALKQARCNYAEAAIEYCEECLFCSENV